MLFYKFIKSYIEATTGEESPYTNIDVITVDSWTTQNTSVAYHYSTLFLEKEDRLIFLINQLDEWSYRMQPSAVNNIENITKAIVEKVGLDKKKLSRVSFKVVFMDPHQNYPTRDESKRDSIRYLLWDKSNDAHEKIELKSDILYTSIEECNSAFAMVKPFIISLAKKIEAQKKVLKQDVFAHANVKEQTFYNWQKNNPDAVKAITDGYFYSQIEEIVSCLATLPDLQAENWRDYQPMKYIDGEEY